LKRQLSGMTAQCNSAATQKNSVSRSTARYLPSHQTNYKEMNRWNGWTSPQGVCMTLVLFIFVVLTL
jgi:hypothetical protein